MKSQSKGGIFEVYHGWIHQVNSFMCFFELIVILGTHFLLNDSSFWMDFHKAWLPLVFVSFVTFQA
jgi:hypothetical protein